MENNEIQPQVTPKLENDKPRISKLEIVLLILIFILGGLYLFAHWRDNTSKPAMQSDIDTSSWQTYRNEEFGFEFEYPSEYTIEEFELFEYEDEPLKEQNIRLKSGSTELIMFGVNSFPGDIDCVDKPMDDIRSINVFEITKTSCTDSNGNLNNKYSVKFDSNNMFLFVEPQYYDLTENVLNTLKFNSSYQTYRNEEFGFELKYPRDWIVTQSSKPSAINITKGDYILYINGNAQQVSGVIGGRFGEIAKGAPSVSAIIDDPSSYPIWNWIEEKTNLGSAGSRIDLYDKQTNDKWFFSYITLNGGFFNNTPTLQPPYGYVITLAYNSTNPVDLPKIGNAELNSMLNEMTEIAESLELF